MPKFTCQNEECKKDHRKGEDARLHLIVEYGQRTEYYINNDGSLEHYDSDGTGQDVKIECPICGQKYELGEPYGYYEILEKHFLPFSKSELKDMKLTKSS